LMLRAALAAVRGFLMRLGRVTVVANLCTIWQTRSLDPVRRAWAASRGLAQHAAHAHAEEIAHGIDCRCFYTENFYVSQPVEGHFTYNGPAEFREENADLLSSLGDATGEKLVSVLEAESRRRRDLVQLAVARKRRIGAEYSRKHGDLWRLHERWLHPDFLRLTEAARVAEATGRSLDKFATPPAIAEGVYALQVFSQEFCALLCDELDHFSASGLPAGRPNSMNNAGVLLDELGFSPDFLEPLLREYLRPLSSALPALASLGGAHLDHHKSFVVRYKMGEVLRRTPRPVALAWPAGASAPFSPPQDEELAAHYDNSEVTLNVNLGREFLGGELVFYGPKEDRSASVSAYHEWSRRGVGHGVLHIGRQARTKAAGMPSLRSISLLQCSVAAHVIDCSLNHTGARSIAHCAWREAQLRHVAALLDAAKHHRVPNVRSD